MSRIGIMAGILLIATSCNTMGQDQVKLNKLTSEEKQVIINKGTERAWTGEYVDHKEKGTYLCKWCDAPLYLSQDKFDSHCGWPSFDDEIKGAVTRIPDADGMRTEIICTQCGGHLGHVFIGEGFTEKNTRHCVNSISLKFQPAKESVEKGDKATAIFAGGCFWGVEHYFKQAPGVLETEVGYIGGDKENPTYEEVCQGNTGHVEAIRVTYDPGQTTYRDLAKLFFEIHDPTQVDRQGPDVGEQYRSEVFFKDAEQEKITRELISLLKQKGLQVVTRVTPASTFWPAERYHQDYYEKTGHTPYCHFYTKRF